MRLLHNLHASQLKSHVVNINKDTAQLDLRSCLTNEYFINEILRFFLNGLSSPFHDKIMISIRLCARFIVIARKLQNQCL